MWKIMYFPRLTMYGLGEKACHQTRNAPERVPEVAIPPIPRDQTLSSYPNPNVCFIKFIVPFANFGLRHDRQRYMCS